MYDVKAMIKAVIQPAIFLFCNLMEVQIKEGKESDSEGSCLVKELKPMTKCKAASN